MTSIVLGCLWVLASAIVALMPMRRQYVPGVTLLVAAPLLIVYIGYENGWLWTLIGLFAFVSMFRNPLRYFAKKALGIPVELPKELRDRQTEKGS
ncbi:MAG: DUF2484 family protein [Pseudomonadota bacterium]